MPDQNPFALEEGNYHVRCTRECGFVANEAYVLSKTRFPAGMCPRSNCGAPLKVVDPFTFTELPDKHIETDPNSRNHRRIVDGPRPGKGETPPAAPAGVP